MGVQNSQTSTESSHKLPAFGQLIDSTRHFCSSLLLLLRNVEEREQSAIKTRYFWAIYKQKANHELLSVDIEIIGKWHFVAQQSGQAIKRNYLQDYFGAKNTRSDDSFISTFRIRLQIKIPTECTPDSQVGVKSPDARLINIPLHRVTEEEKL